MTDPWGNPLPPDDRPTPPPPPPAPSMPAPPSPVAPPPPPPASSPNPAWPGAAPAQPTAPQPPQPTAQPYPGQPYPAQPYPGQPYPALPRNDGRAITSLVLGITSLACAGYLGIILAVPAVVFGVRARRTIAASNGWRRGDGMAVAGIVLGIIGIVISVVSIVFLLLNPNFLQDILDRLTTTTTSGTGTTLKNA